MKTIARCGIYESRPQICKDYPTVGHWTPSVCTYSFPYGDDRREGECACEIGACCAVPREGGEPGGAPMPEEAGGSSCKHLVWVDVEEEEPKEKIGSMHDSSLLLRVIQ
jgi:hypothetical protein